MKFMFSSSHEKEFFVLIQAPINILEGSQKVLRSWFPAHIILLITPIPVFFSLENPIPPTIQKQQ